MIELGGSGVEGGGSNVGSGMEALQDGRVLVSLLGGSVESRGVEDEGDEGGGGGGDIAEVGGSVDSLQGEVIDSILGGFIGLQDGRSDSFLGEALDWEAEGNVYKQKHC